MFANSEVPIDALPSAERLHWQALDSRYVLRLQVQSLLLVGFALPALAAGHYLVVAVAEENVPLAVQIGAWALFAVASAWALVWPALDVPKRGFALRDKDIVYKYGVLWRSVKAVPFNRVQHAATGSGPLDRRFGLATLTVFTAGGSGGDLRVPGLNRELAERLRGYVIDRVRHDAEGGGDATAVGAT